MISTVLRYEIEIKYNNFEWKLRRTITPNYEVEDHFTVKRFLFWTREKHFNVIRNERATRIKARKRALKLARKFFQSYSEVRVFVIFKFPEIDEPIRHRTWENNRFCFL